MSYINLIHMHTEKQLPIYCEQNNQTHTLDYDRLIILSDSPKLLLL